MGFPLVVILVGCGATPEPATESAQPDSQPITDDEIAAEERLGKAHEKAKRDMERVVGGEPVEPDLRPVDLDPEMLAEAEQSALEDHGKKRLAEVKRCVSQGTRSPPVSGMLVVELEVAKEGSVTQAKAVQCPMESSACRCVESAFRRFRHSLGKETGSNATVSFDLAEGPGDGTTVHPVN